MGAGVVFLNLNGMILKPDGPEREELTLEVAVSRIDRDETTRGLQWLILSV